MRVRHARNVAQDAAGDGDEGSSRPAPPPRRAACRRGLGLPRGTFRRHVRVLNLSSHTDGNKSGGCATTTAAGACGGGGRRGAAKRRPSRGRWIGDGMCRTRALKDRS